jgi:hypothetical protein
MMPKLIITDSEFVRRLLALGLMTPSLNAAAI